MRECVNTRTCAYIETNRAEPHPKQKKKEKKKEEEEEEEQQKEDEEKKSRSRTTPTFNHRYVSQRDYHRRTRCRVATDCTALVAYPAAGRHLHRGGPSVSSSGGSPSPRHCCSGRWRYPPGRVSSCCCCPSLVAEVLVEPFRRRLSRCKVKWGR